MGESANPAVDVEIEALLGFAPVKRHTRRHDGWPPELQRAFVAALARLGNVGRAAHTIDRTESGAYKVRTSAGGEEFADAWDEALALYCRRNPKLERLGRPSRGEIRAGGRGSGGAPAPGESEPDPGFERRPRRSREEIVEGIFNKYFLKVRAEREARLAGRIAAADYYVRQLTYIEIVLELGGQARELLDALRRGGRTVFDIVATPMSVLLDRIRREAWAEADEPERPPLPALGEHDGEVSTGIPNWYTAERDGDYFDWQTRQREQEQLAAEAQRAWEEKARADAAAWRRRVANDTGEAAPVAANDDAGDGEAAA
jgi:hypothetical protein